MGELEAVEEEGRPPEGRRRQRRRQRREEVQARVRRSLVGSGVFFPLPNLVEILIT